MVMMCVCVIFFSPTSRLYYHVAWKPNIRNLILCKYWVRTAVFPGGYIFWKVLSWFERIVWCECVEHVLAFSVSKLYLLYKHFVAVTFICNKTCKQGPTIPTYGESCGPALTAHGSLDLKQEIQIQMESLLLARFIACVFLSISFHGR
jgi:hypothetical protein